MAGVEPSAVALPDEKEVLNGASGNLDSSKTTLPTLICRTFRRSNHSRHTKKCEKRERERKSSHTFDNILCVNMFTVFGFIVFVDAFDTEQLLDCVIKLKHGYILPHYCQVNVSDDIILDGILVFHDQRVRNLMNMKIFVDT
ncbi:hypothetical protein UlMin_013797, partial [Ulmus minor]